MLTWLTIPRVIGNLLANASAISVFISARLGVVYAAGVQTSSAIPGNAIVASFRTTEADGTPLYYTIE